MTNEETKKFIAEHAADDTAQLLLVIELVSVTLLNTTDCVKVWLLLFWQMQL